MLRKVIKFLIYSIIIYGIYYAFKMYVVYTMAVSFGANCNPRDEDLKDLVARKASNRELELFLHTHYTCLKENQTPIQKFFFPIPDRWINPPPDSVTYKDVENLLNR